MTKAQSKFLLSIAFKRRSPVGPEWIVARNLVKAGLLDKIYPLCIPSEKGEQAIFMLVESTRMGGKIRSALSKPSSFAGLVSKAVFPSGLGAVR